MANRISEAVLLTMDSMLRAGEYTWKICETLGVSSSTVQKRRNKLKQEGHDHIWHPSGGVVSRSIYGA